MARWRATQGMVGAPPGMPYAVYGGAIASSAGSALPGDLVWPAVCVIPNPCMIPLDSPALALTLAARPSIDNGAWPTAIGT
jgi:hypothetical protein